MGIRKVNLSDLAGKLNQRGRSSFQDEELAEAFQQMLEDGEPFIWETAIVEGKTDKARSSSRAKWRHRAVSVFGQLNTGESISVCWTVDDECVIMPKANNA